MKHATSTRENADRTRSDLAVLVDTEARIDRDIASARDRAAQLDRETAEQARRDELVLATEIERERVRIAAEVAAIAKTRAAEVEAASLAAIARFDAIRDECATEYARAVVEELLALVRAEAPP